MLKKLNTKDLFKNTAGYKYANRTSSLAMKNQVKEALEKGGFGKVKAGRIARGIKNGTANLTRWQSVKVLQALKKANLLKSSIRDVKGTVGRFNASADRTELTAEETKRKNLENLRKIRQNEERSSGRELLNRLEEERFLSAEKENPKSASPVADEVEDLPLN